MRLKKDSEKALPIWINKNRLTDAYNDPVAGCTSKSRDRMRVLSISWVTNRARGNFALESWLEFWREQEEEFKRLSLMRLLRIKFSDRISGENVHKYTRLSEIGCM